MAPSARPDTIPPKRLGRRLFTLLVCGLAAPASAQVVGGGLNTRVNGSDGGSCQAGACRVDGGIGAGPNGFYRFRQFDTRQGVDGVTIDNRGRTNVVVGVTAPQGTFLNKPLALSEAANLFWLSPGGIWLGRGASFSPVNTLLLSTATSLNLGQGKGFDALRTTAEQAAGLNGVPDPSQPAIVSMGTLNDLGLAAPGPVVLAGGRLQVDRSLLIQAPPSALQAVAGAGSSLGRRADRRALPEHLRGDRRDADQADTSRFGRQSPDPEGADPHLQRSGAGGRTLKHGDPAGLTRGEAIGDRHQMDQPAGLAGIAAAASLPVGGHGASAVAGNGGLRDGGNRDSGDRDGQGGQGQSSARNQTLTPALPYPPCLEPAGRWR